MTVIDAGRGPGGWWPPSLRRAAAAAVLVLLTSPDVAALTLSLPPDAGAPPGLSAVVPLHVDDASGMLGTDIVITYDPSVAQATGVSTTWLANGQSLTTNLSQPGTIRISLFGPVPLSGGGVLLELSFTSSGTANAQAILDLVTASVNEGAIPAALEDGRYCVQGITSEVRDLRVRHDGFASTAALLDWASDPYAAAYNVYRAGEADLRDLACLLSAVPEPLARDEADPDSGLAFFYLVTAVNCRGEATLGFNTFGEERLSPVSCP